MQLLNSLKNPSDPPGAGAYLRPRCLWHGFFPVLQRTLGHRHL